MNAEGESAADKAISSCLPRTGSSSVVASEVLGRVMGRVLDLVECFGWRRATLICSLVFSGLAVGSVALVQVLLGDTAGLRFGALLATAGLALVLIVPSLAVAFRLVEHLERTRTRLLIEIDRRVIAEQQLRRLATTDELTGLGNRRHFVERAREAVAVARRYGQWCTLAVVDVDRFKRVNDRHGHQAGDQALIALAAVLKANLRATDLAARFGGDEFVALLPLTDPDAGKAAAERIRDAVRRQCGSPELTVSIGIASVRGEGASLEELLARADQALYDAKGVGRNRISVFRGSEEGQRRLFDFDRQV
jgi:diguanylate cyclase (GGDEF)-like protein